MATGAASAKAFAPTWPRPGPDARRIGYYCAAHGLRKAGATIAAENGATEEQLKAIFGWEDAAQAAIYTQAASQKKLAGSAMRLLLPTGNGGRVSNRRPTRL